MEKNVDIYDVIHAALEKGVRTWSEYVKKNMVHYNLMDEEQKKLLKEEEEKILESAQEEFNPGDPEYLFQFVRALESFYDVRDEGCYVSLIKQGKADGAIHSKSAIKELR